MATATVLRQPLQLLFAVEVILLRLFELPSRDLIEAHTAEVVNIGGRHHVGLLDQFVAFRTVQFTLSGVRFGLH